MLEELFPGLANSSFQITSPKSRDYNCIAWAANDQLAWWWPDDDPDNDAVWWPSGVPREETLTAFVAAYGTIGYTPCADAQHQGGKEKIAIFARDDGRPTHAARQLPNGRWTSKLGLMEDIEHELRALEGDCYGRVVQILSRTIESK